MHLYRVVPIIKKVCSSFKGSIFSIYFLSKKVCSFSWQVMSFACSTSNLQSVSNTYPKFCCFWIFPWSLVTLGSAICMCQHVLRHYNLHWTYFLSKEYHLQKETNFHGCLGNKTAKSHAYKLSKCRPKKKYLKNEMLGKRVEKGRLSSANCSVFPPPLPCLWSIEAFSKIFSVFVWKLVESKAMINHPPHSHLSSCTKENPSLGPPSE